VHILSVQRICCVLSLNVFTAKHELMNPLFPFRPADDAAVATWVTNRLQGFATSVVSIVPAEFPAYARIYHPAWRTINGIRAPVRWSEVAKANKRIAHRRMQWPGIMGSYHVSQNQAPPASSDTSFENPSEGSLPLEVARTLWQVLAPYTRTATTCWFAVWEGFGCLPAEIRSTPSFAIPERQLHLFWASIEAIEVSFCDPPFYHQSANLWWPDDQAWCVSTEIDFMTTYMAGTDEAIAALMAHADLEVDVVEPWDGVTWASDTINPTLPEDSP
jgi:hypothetical protein